ncbi:MAG TPA: ATP-binding cassette domain-containing protein [Gemmatimonadaceae bacterium]|nr:ATP-binding cassette domain-containing protein [Gemmatimonadaceae bacterium]
MHFSARGLRKQYAAGTPGCSAVARVLCGVNLELAPADIVGIAGARGAGKTTLVRCVAGLARPDAGALHWGPAAQRPRVVSLSPAAYPFDTVRDVIERASSDSAVDPCRLAEMIGALGLAAAADTAQVALTTDERARLALAIGLATQHALLLLDGTCDALAAGSRAAVRDRLRAHAAAGGAVLLAGRDGIALAALADRVVELRDGVLHSMGEAGHRPASARVAEAPASPEVR